MKLNESLYYYTAIVNEVYDGDTITVDIDLGLEVWLRDQKIRLWGVDTPELRGIDKALGKEVRDWVRKEILYKEVIIETVKDRTGKYGRWLANVHYYNNESYSKSLCLNDQLMDMGYPAPEHWQ